ncbi:hypothetical protein EXIGLDRAFT_465411 [Exidia glandulosa HHB12029]|uniref:BTB domain-containing protein n=1 Tax=Exidia glandulosa HHB12029 TaxID=1314781 RepID=A0A165K2R4_EXIGL|nr:hypothetical protein EXIGLDRAFT_465411 [Exidia glandulosa HHB12029]
MASLTADSAVVRDPVYYEDDGNVILVAESTLFKVHKSRLRKMSAVFADLLALPQGDAAVDGQTDECPIVLAGDTSEQVRSLFWALYSRPDEVVAYLGDTDNNGRWLRLLHVVELAHKYDCMALAQWALNTVAAHCRTADSLGSTEAIIALINLHRHRDQLPGLIEWAEPFLHRTTAANNVSYFTLLRAAELSQWDDLARHAYYRFVCGGASSWTSFRLTASEKLRLLTGSYNVTEVLAALPSLDMMATHLPCSSAPYCTSDWPLIWRECCSRSLSQGGKDVLAVLQQLYSLLEAVGAGKLVISGVRPRFPSGPSAVPVHNCYARSLGAAKEVADLGSKVVQRCFDEELDCLSANSPEVKALWTP